MATSMPDSFDSWLTEKLKSLSEEFDTDVFVSYIIGILDTDSPDDEIAESIEEILAQVLDEEQSAIARKEIVDVWSKYNKNALEAAANAVKKDAVEVLAEIMENQTLATVKGVKLTDEEKAHKQAILAQYAQVSDGEETDDDAPGAAAGVSNGLMEKNVNAAAVAEAQKVQREVSKQEHEKKKEKDKLDRDAQKQKQQQRKDKEKTRTQKQERRR